MVDAVQLTMEQMLSRLPDKDFLTTREVQHACGDVHEVTVFRWVAAGLLKSKRVRSSRGRKSFYRRGDVATFIRKRFGVLGATRGTSPSDSSKGTARKRAASRGASPP